MNTHRHGFRPAAACFALISAVVLVFLPGCATPGGGDAFRPPTGVLADHGWQIRRFEGLTEKAMLSACAGVLQDLGFNLEESEAKLGVIIGSKDRTARKQQTPAQAITETALEAAAIVGLAMLTGQLVWPSDDPPERQVIRASLFVQPDSSGCRNAFTVRLAFQRIVYTRGARILSAQTVTDATLAQAFFDALSKSTFLEAQQL